jgi:hypothetical protein
MTDERLKISDIPDEIIEAEIKLSDWMCAHGHEYWELGEVCSRNHAYDLKAYQEGGVTEELLRRNDGYIKVGRGCAIVRECDIPIAYVIKGCAKPN